jgi:hypothetical protein
MTGYSLQDLDEHFTANSGRSVMDQEEFFANADTEFETEAPRPYWLPDGVEFDLLPDELKAAIAGIINPAYRELVLQADAGLPQTTGVTIVYLLWLELLDQIQLGSQSVSAVSDPDAQRERHTTISRLLRTVGAKNKTTGLLLRIRELRWKHGVWPPMEHQGSWATPHPNLPQESSEQ